MTQIIRALSDVADRYDALFVDLWGCVHNGVTAYPEAVEALRHYRAAGGAVVLVTNSPRAREGVEGQLAGFGVPEECWDTIATSGDSARAAMFRGAVGRKVYFIGTEADLAFFEPLRVIPDPVAVERVALEAAEGIVCTGPFDPEADLSESRPDLLRARERGLELLCANPDIVVDRGETREWCAGALARMYTDLGGRSLYFGKPHPPIYDLAHRRLAALGRAVPRDRILAIGDGAHTDVAGAIGDGLDSLFISGGLAAEVTGTSHQPDPAALTGYLAEENVAPTYAIGRLR
jgi:HAD superfamily hydrolase (TIGR01459 family)